MADTDEDWRPRDFWLGLFFFAIGALIAAWVVTAAKKGYPLTFWIAGVPLAPLLLLIGGNATWQGLRALVRGPRA